MRDIYKDFQKDGVMKKELGFGIVGAGMIAPIHADAIKRVPGARLVAFCSRSAEKARNLAKEYDVRFYDDYTEMLKDDEIDCISICTPSGTHLDIGRLAAGAGKHIIVEKPVDITVEKADELVEECRRNNVRMGSIFQMRYNKSSIKAKEIIGSGKLGRIIMADAYMKFYRPPEYYKNSTWKGTCEIDGGAALINQAIHGIDLLLWLAGEVKSVYAVCRTQRHDIEAEDTVAAVLEFENGATGVIEAATSVYPDMQQEIHVHGINGTMILAGTEVTYIKMLELMDGTKYSEQQKSGDTLGEPHYLQYKEFVEAVSRGRDPILDGAEGIKALKLVRAVYGSSKSRRSIML